MQQIYGSQHMRFFHLRGLRGQKVIKLTIFRSYLLCLHEIMVIQQLKRCVMTRAIKQWQSAYAFLPFKGFKGTKNGKIDHFQVLSSLFTRNSGRSIAQKMHNDKSNKAMMKHMRFFHLKGLRGEKLLKITIFRAYLLCLHEIVVNLQLKRYVMTRAIKLWQSAYGVLPFKGFKGTKTGKNGHFHDPSSLFT